MVISWDKHKFLKDIQDSALVFTFLKFTSTQHVLLAPLKVYVVEDEIQLARYQNMYAHWKADIHIQKKLLHTTRRQPQLKSDLPNGSRFETMFRQ